MKRSWFLGVSGGFVIGLTGISVGAGQTAAKVAPKAGFEVASIRQSKPDTMSNFGPFEGARIHEAGISLTILIQIAFDLEQDQVAGPDWMRSQFYDLNATTEGEAVLTREQMRPLLQRLLIERFNLTFHRETKSVPGYALVVAKNGPKLTESKGGAAGGNYILRDGVQLRSASMGMLAAALRSPLHQPVIDKTGVAGEYVIDLKYAPEGDENSTMPSIFTALQEQLGLKVQAEKVSLEMLVVDHAEKMPAEN
jgi:uncharacterized protein (TIGR03435 family)